MIVTTFQSQYHDDTDTYIQEGVNNSNLHTHYIENVANYKMAFITKDSTKLSFMID